MDQVNFAQGSPEWHAHRAKNLNASDVPVVMNLSSYRTRDELLHERATGLTKEIDAHTQRIFDKGHEYEAMARPIIEKHVDEMLSPITGATVIDGLPLSASFDGIDFGMEICFEHKTLNQKLAKVVTIDDLDMQYKVQMQQQMMVSGARKCIFVASKGTEEGMIKVWFEYDEELAKDIIAAWKQFAIDLESYEAPEAVEEVFAEVVGGLPAVSVQVSGQIDIIDNFQVFGDALRMFIKDQLIKSPENDQDFADLEEQIKTLKKAEDALNVAESAMLAQVESVNTLKGTKDMLHKLARDNRLMAEKIIKSKKEEIKARIVSEASEAVRAHRFAIEEELGVIKLPEIANTLAAAIKGKRSIDMMRSALNDEVAAIKIQSNEDAAAIRANLKTLDDAGDYRFLFNDIQQVIMKAPDDFANMASSRIAEHDKREAARLEAERERIRKEEQDRIEAEQRQAEKVEEKPVEAVAEPIQRRQIQSAPVTHLEVEAAPVIAEPELSPDLVAWCDKNRVSKKARLSLLEILSKEF